MGMKVTVTFDLDPRYRDEEKNAKHAQQLLDTIIYDYQCGMVCIKSIVVSSSKFLTKIVPNKKDE